ncbi:hypothetical protein RhiirC2_762117 [Rhizophagus irregularis]|uniref:Uncharacterized protein n=1 Tax=Rhizophagus irregularis TaxID=588596 RepID=A0A2N1MEK2_9GLOM|nr:hypothetical protein RhiirC2_762117 [Rhizophagus irregularis]
MGATVILCLHLVVESSVFRPIFHGTLSSVIPSSVLVPRLMESLAILAIVPFFAFRFGFLFLPQF